MSKNTAYQLGIAVLALILFLPASQVHLFDWDEINFAEAAREMIISGDYFTVMIDFQPFWEKPPLYIWMQVLSMKLFGITEFAARFPNIVCGIFTLLVLFRIGKRIYNEQFAIIWVLAYLGSLLPQVYFMSGIIDPVYNLFIFLALYCAYEFWTQNQSKYLPYAALWAGLAVLTKGPVALLILALIIAVHSIAVGGNKVLISLFKTRVGWLAILTFIIICSLFYGVEFVRHGPAFFIENIDYHLRLSGANEAGHAQPFYYHFLVLLIGCLPTSILMLGGFRSANTDESHQRDFTRLMLVMFFVVLLVFSLVSTKIIHYSSLCYFPLTFLAGRYIYNTAYRKMKHRTQLSIWMLVLSGLFSLLLIFLPLIMNNVQAFIPYVQDPFAVANLGADVKWHWMDGVGGFVYFISLVVFVYLVSRGRLARAYATLLIGTALGINITFKSVVPKVERITQRAAIEFYEGLQGEACYVDVLDFKSYAHFFYARTQPQPGEPKNREELLDGALDKPAYFVVRNVDAHKYRSHPNLIELYQRNGFVFFKRPAH